MADSEGPRSPGTKKLKQSSLSGLFSQSTKCAREPESESSDIAMVFEQAKQFDDHVYTRR